jgi:branched-chain amino acid transport system permease protein
MAQATLSAPAAARRALFAGNALPATLFVIFALVPLIATFKAEAYVLSLGTRVMIFSIAALALDLLIGYGALVSFGHAAFVGLGAYAVGILGSHGINDALISLPVALGVSALFAYATGIVCLRTKGVYFIMITLAFGQMAFFFMVSLSAYGGDDGLTIAARSTLAGIPIFRSDLTFYYVVFALLLAFFLLARTIIASRFGRVLRGVHDNTERMRAIGFSPFLYQLAAYCIAGAVAGIAGTLLANQTEFVSPAYMSWQRSGDLIFMVMLGGMGTLTGPILGAAGLLLLEELLPGISEHWKLGLGVILILVVLFSRGGITGLLRGRDG